MSRLLDILSQPGEFITRYSTVLTTQIEDTAEMRDLAAATALNIAQNLDLTDEIKRGVSSQQLVDRRKLYAMPLRLYESELRADTNVVTFGSGLTYGDGTVYGAVRKSATSFTLPAGVAGIGYIADRLANETAVLLPGADFAYRGPTITFRSNPFDTFAAVDVYNSAGSLIDRQITLWMVDVDVWDRLAEDMFGAVAGIVDDGEPGYGATVAALWKVIVDGPARASVLSALLIAAGLKPAVGGDIVESVSAGLVVTSEAVYISHPDAAALVAVGDVLEPGQSVFDTVVLRDLASPAADLAGISAVTFSVLTAEGTVVIGVPNADVAVRVVNGAVEFDVGGSVEDIDLFWSAVRAREQAAGLTLAEAMTTEFGAVPAQLNPLRYLCSHQFLGNTVVVTTRPPHFLSPPTLMAKLSAALLPLLPARTLVVQHSLLPDTFDSGSLDSTYDGVDIIDGFAAADRSRPQGVAAPASELAYADLRPMLTNYAR